MIDLLAAAVAVVAAAALGACMLRAVRAVPADDRDRLLWMTAMGLGMWGLVGLGLAAAQALQLWAVLGLAVLALAVGGRDAYRALLGVLGRRPRRWTLLAAPAATVAALAVVLLAPVVTGDQTKYQLAYPKLYAEAGGLVATPWTFWGNQQFVQNFLFALGYVVRGERLALLLGAVWLPLAAAALARLVDRHLWRGAGGAAAALLVTAPMVWTLASKAGADLALVTYTTLAVTAFLDWRRGDAVAWRRCALAAGFAGASKVMGLLTPALVGASLLGVDLARRARPARTLRLALAFGALSGAVAAGPYVRNLVETGNPLHPFAAGVFGGRHWSAEAGRYLDEYYRQYQVDRAGRRAGVPYRGLELARFPWDATMVPESFERAARQSLDIGPFALAFLPGALWLAWRRAPVAWVLGLGAAYTAVIAAGAWAHPRYVFSGVVLVLAACVAGARALGGRWFPAVIAATLVGQLAVTSRLVVGEFPDRLRTVTGQMTREAFLERHSARFRFWRRACPVVGTAGLVMVLEKIPHPYFIECPFVLASYLEQARIDYRTIPDAGRLAAAATELGVTHVAVARADLGRHADPYEAHATAVWRDWTASLGTPSLEVGGYVLYAVPGAAGAAVP
jgi:hypothetical protein